MSEEEKKTPVEIRGEKWEAAAGEIKAVLKRRGLSRTEAFGVLQLVISGLDRKTRSPKDTDKQTRKEPETGEEATAYIA